MNLSRLNLLITILLGMESLFVLKVKQGKQQILFDAIPDDSRITLTSTQGIVKAFGLRCAPATANMTARVRIAPHEARAVFPQGRTVAVAVNRRWFSH